MLSILTSEPYVYINFLLLIALCRKFQLYLHGLKPLGLEYLLDAACCMTSL